MIQRARYPRYASGRAWERSGWSGAAACIMPGMRYSCTTRAASRSWTSCPMRHGPTYGARSHPTANDMVNLTRARDASEVIGSRPGQIASTPHVCAGGSKIGHGRRRRGWPPPPAHASFRAGRCHPGGLRFGRPPFRQSPLHRLNLLHVGCKKRVPAFARINDKRMLHPLRVLAAKFEKLRVADTPKGMLTRIVAPNESPWRLDEAMNLLAGWKKTFGLVGRQNDFGIRHRNLPQSCAHVKQSCIWSEAIIRSISTRCSIKSHDVARKATASLSFLTKLQRGKI
jgi:hypothetical protein